MRNQKFQYVSEAINYANIVQQAEKHPSVEYLKDRWADIVRSYPMRTMEEINKVEKIKADYFKKVKELIDKIVKNTIKRKHQSDVFSLKAGETVKRLKKLA